MTMIGEDRKDYRRELNEELRGGVGLMPRHRAALLEGFAAQVLREEAERKRRELKIADDRHLEVIIDALKEHGFVPGAADRFVQEFTESIRELARRESDHEAYRLLADAVVHVIRKEDDPDDWDDEQAEVSLLMTFVEWLPDMIRHRAAEAILASPKLRRETADSEERFERQGIEAAAEYTDPFQRNDAGQWIRKTDGAPVPWPVVKE